MRKRWRLTNLKLLKASNSFSWYSLTFIVIIIIDLIKRGESLQKKKKQTNFSRIEGHKKAKADVQVSVPKCKIAHFWKFPTLHKTLLYTSAL